MLVGISSHVVAFNLSQNRCAAGWELLETVSAGGAVQIVEAARLIKTNKRKLVACWEAAIRSKRELTLHGFNTGTFFAKANSY